MPQISTETQPAGVLMGASLGIRENPDEPPANREYRIAICLLLAGFFTTALFGWLSPQGVLQFDDLTHYLFAKWAWRWPAYLLNDWGRPGFTALYFLPAAIGWPACRLLSAVLGAASGWLAFRIAQMLGFRHAWAVILLAFVQPLFFQISQTTLTEMPMAFYLTLAIYLALRDRWSWSSVVISMTFITRYEAIIFLPVWLVYARHRRIDLRRLWPILWAPLAVSLCAWVAGVPPIVERFIHPTPSSQYGRGGWLTFFARALHAWGPGVTVPAMIGLGGLILRRGGGLVVGCVGLYFVTQTVIRALGLFDSGGYARFLVPISPLVAIAALNGWRLLRIRLAAGRSSVVWLAGGAMILLWLAMERQLVLHEARKVIIAELPQIYYAKWAIRISTLVFMVITLVSSLGSGKSLWRHRVRLLMPGAIVGLVLLACYGLCRPLSEPPQAAIIEGVRHKLMVMGLGKREILSANVWLDYATGRMWPPDRPSVRKQLEEAPIGTLFAWERQFAGSQDHKLRLDEFTNNPSFRLVLQSAPMPYHSGPYLHIFEKIKAWP